MSLIFISYRRDDVAGHAGRLFAALTAAYPRGQIFLDISDIETGERWSDRIRAAVETSLLVLCLVGPRWNPDRLGDPDDIVRREIRIALSKGALVVPVLFDGARLPEPSDLPDDCRGMLDNHALVFDAYDFELYEEKLKRLPSIMDGLFRRMHEAGSKAAGCELVFKCSSNRGEQTIYVDVDGKYFTCFNVRGESRISIDLPVGFHTIEMEYHVLNVSRASGFSHGRDIKIGSHRLFFEPGTYEARVERHEPLLPLFSQRVTFHPPYKVSGR